MDFSGTPITAYVPMTVFEGTDILFQSLDLKNVLLALSCLPRPSEAPDGMQLLLDQTFGSVDALQLAPFLVQSLPASLFAPAQGDEAALRTKATALFRKIDTLCLLYAFFAARTMMAAISQLDQLRFCAEFQNRHEVPLPANIAAQFSRPQFVEFLESMFSVKQAGLSWLKMGVPEACSLPRVNGKRVLPLHLDALKLALSETATELQKELVRADYPAFDEVAAELATFRSSTSADLLSFYCCNPTTPIGSAVLPASSMASSAYTSLILLSVICWWSFCSKSLLAF